MHLAKLKGSFTIDSFVNIRGTRECISKRVNTTLRCLPRRVKKNGNERRERRRGLLRQWLHRWNSQGLQPSGVRSRRMRDKPFPVLNFEDLITYEDGSIFGEAPAPTAPQQPKSMTPVLVPMIPKEKASPAISIRASPSIATSSSSSCSSEHEKMELFRQMARGAEQASVMSKAQLDVLMCL